MDEVQKLLNLWKLSKLCDVLKEHEVNILALKCLTENDICELISKIGPRSIFRARLQQWRKENLCELFESPSTMTETRKYDFEPSTISTKKLRVDESIAVKLETATTEVEGEEEFSENNTTTDDALLEVLPNSPRSHLEEDYIYDTQMSSSLKRKLITGSKDFSIESIDLEEIEQINRQCHSSSNDVEKKLNVLEVLTGNFDGRKAISFYKINNILDLNHRRKVVTVIICASIEQKINMYVETFDNLVKQILELFPNETYDAYFIPRAGTSSPKGALYNKFLNLSRQLRKDGLLGYRNQRRIVSSGASSIENV